MKRNYIKPSMVVVLLNTTAQLLSGSEVNRNVNNAGLDELIQGGSGQSRARSFDGWDDEEDF